MEFSACQKVASRRRCFNGLPNCSQSTGHGVIVQRLLRSYSAHHNFWRFYLHFSGYVITSECMAVSSIFKHDQIGFAQPAQLHTIEICRISNNNPIKNSKAITVL